MLQIALGHPGAAVRAHLTLVKGRAKMPAKVDRLAAQVCQTDSVAAKVRARMDEIGLTPEALRAMTGLSQRRMANALQWTEGPRDTTVLRMISVSVTWRQEVIEQLLDGTLPLDADPASLTESSAEPEREAPRREAPQWEDAVWKGPSESARASQVTTRHGRSLKSEVEELRERVAILEQALGRLLGDCSDTRKTG